jgi:single-stranded-DNA-specific exonuclease
MDIARDVIDLFSVKDVDRARLLAGKLDRLNAERQEEERRILRSIDERIAGDPALCEAYCIVVDGEGWHRGVIGIAATRVVERYHRPALVISRNGEEAFGSGRSIRAFHLLEAVESSHALFTRYGGHSHACGFAMPSANIAQLRNELDAFARTRLTEADFDPVLDVEAELDLDEVTPGLYQALQLLEPHGAGNHEPAFSARGVRLIAPPKILKDKHIKLKLKAAEEIARLDSSSENCDQQDSGGEELSAVAILVTPRCHPDGAAINRAEKTQAKDLQLRTEKRELRSGAKTVFDALGWHMAERLQQSPLLAGDTIDVAFTIGHNDHPDFGGLELSLRDFKAR